MKQFFVDLGFVIVAMCIMSILFGDYNVSKTMFQRSIDNFEENVSSDEVVQEPYVTIQDSSDNNVSSFFKTVSDGCVKVIQYVALIFSNIISMILGVMVY